MKFYIILAIGFFAIKGDVVEAQNLQYAHLCPTFDREPRIISNGSTGDLIYTRSSKPSFQPDCNNPNFAVEQMDDAFLLSYSGRGDFNWYTQFNGVKSVWIEQVWVSNTGEIFAFLRSKGSDSIEIKAPTHSFTIYPPTVKSDYHALFVVKLDKQGKYKDYVFLGFDGGLADNLNFSFPNFIVDEIPMLVSSSTTYIIPGTSDTLNGSNQQYQSAVFYLNCDSFSIDKIRHFSVQTKNPANFLNGVVEFKYASKQGSAYDSLHAVQLYYDGELHSLSQVLYASEKTSIVSKATFLDTLYISFKSPELTKDSIFHVGNEYLSCAWDQLLLTKWVNNKLVAKKKLTKTLEVNFYKSADNELFIFGSSRGEEIKDSTFKLQFFKGNEHIFPSGKIAFWGKLIKDSLAWTSYISSNITPYVSPKVFHIGGKSQYFSQIVNSWTDYDPGTYKYQFHPETYLGQQIVAKYNCYPNAIFTYKQNAQKVEFINQTAGSDSFKWDVGVITKPIKDRNPVFYYPKVGEYWVMLIAYNTCGTDTFRFPVYIDKILSTPNISSQDVTVYPNPVQEFITVSTSQSITSITIYDMLGKEILRKNDLRDNRIFVGDLKNGSYVVRIETNKGLITKLVEKI